MALYTLNQIEAELPGDGAYWIAPGAVVVGNVKLAREASVWFGAVLRGDTEPITVGARSNVQDNAVLHTDPGVPLTIGRGCTIGHRATLHSCTIGDNTLVGIGATVLNGTRVGKNCLIGAHTLIPEGKEIPDGVLVLGSPGRVVRPLSEQEVQTLSLSADFYVANWRRFKAELKPDAREPRAV
jgi:carbonic anhydrase/acetyltransferase-like protein (isoleucine patch superfamily)